MMFLLDKRVCSCLVLFEEHCIVLTHLYEFRYVLNRSRAFELKMKKFKYFVITSNHIKLLEVLLQHDLEVQDVAGKTSVTSIYLRYLLRNYKILFSVIAY